MKKISSREKLLAAAAALIVVLAPLQIFAIDPAVERWRGMTERIDATTRMLAKGRRLLDRQPAIEKAYKKWVVPAVQKGTDPEEMGRFLKEIEGMARRGPLRISDLRPLPVSQKRRRKVFAVQLETKAEPARLTRFLYGIEAGSPLLRIDRLALAAGKGEVQAKIVITKIVLSKSKGKRRRAGRPR